ncbi:hypothetical protein ACFVYA_10610 [Amycolatopsis sp. NPDC058278]|uniref:hypothetical protein n=1 Tax=Amycolatopsis sp. NPDC058278 TaxID=3346417 RepID=UPI0036D8E627
MTGIIGLIEKIITSTPNTLRTILITVLVIAAVVGGLWVLRANLTVGPVSVTGREVTSNSTSCASDGSAMGTPVTCGR